MLMFASTMVSKESTSLGLPDFPVSNLHDLAKILVSWQIDNLITE
jgi:hypothetical protein